MKKIALVLILSLILIFSAGCVTESDKIIGNWKTVEPYSDEYYSMNYVVTFNEDNSGKLVETVSPDGITGTFPIIWKKTGDKTYRFEELTTFKLSEDSKSLTSNYGYTYTGGDGFTNGTWVQNGVKGDEYRYEYVFNSDGSGVETYYEGDLVERYNITWRDMGSNMFEYTYIFTVEFSDDGKTLYGIWGTPCKESDGVWTEEPEDDYRYYYSYEFLDDNMCKSVCYYNDSDEVYDIYYYVCSESGNEITLIEIYMTYLEMQDDGTIKDLKRSVSLKKV
ncbi:MAG: hypothetical protein Q4Q53_01875 [Methanocorpusculum sp.]|nr:hypothetical protein [Methanocorpusculum sp.]